LFAGVVIAVALLVSQAIQDVMRLVASVLF